MGKEKENSLTPEFIAAAKEFIAISNRMDEAWIKMVEKKQVSRYRSMDEKRAEELRSGKRPKKGEEYIAKYLRALDDFLSRGEKSP